MIRMLRTRRPARIDERVVETLLNIVNHTPFEVDRIVGEQPGSSDRFLDGRLLTRPDRSCQITPKEPTYALSVCLGY